MNTNTIIIGEIKDHLRIPRELTVGTEKPRAWARDDRVIVKDPRGFKYLGKVLGCHRESVDSDEVLYRVLIWCNTICGWSMLVDVSPHNILGYAEDVLPSEVDREIKALMEQVP